MILIRSPLRITLGGGGTDLKSYYQNHEGILLSAAINKYIYISVLKPFEKGIYLKYSELEKVNTINEIKHPIIRECLEMIDANNNQIEISALADIPSGTGLGSSSSFTTGLIKALYQYKKYHISQEDLAKLACKIEIDILNEPIGKQDQYIASIGGLTNFIFHKNDSVTISPLNITKETIYQLEDNLLLFFTGFTRRASNILNDQKSKSISNNKKMIENLHYIKKLGVLSKESLEKGDLLEFARLMNEHWQFKKNRTNGMTNKQIDEWYDLAMNSGALGGKLVGAGGGGFLMFYAHDCHKLRKVMKNSGLEEVRFNFDFEGTKVLI